jgi:hypothetical protein
MQLQEQVNGNTITINQAKRNLGRFISDMAHVCIACLPDLPSRVQMFLELDFNDNKPPDYCPPGFNNHVADSTHYAESEEWECRKKSVAKLDSGHHKVDLALTYLTARHEGGPDAVPSGISYTKRASDIIPATVSKSLSYSDEQPPQASETVSNTSRNVQPKEVGRPLARQSPSKGKIVKVSSTDTSSPGQTVQALVMPSSSDIATRKKISNMV